PGGLAVLSSGGPVRGGTNTVGLPALHGFCAVDTGCGPARGCRTAGRGDPGAVAVVATYLRHLRGRHTHLGPGCGRRRGAVEPTRLLEQRRDHGTAAFGAHRGGGGHGHRPAADACSAVRPGRSWEGR